MGQDAAPTAAVAAPAAEVVGRRLRVYWPLDDAWYKGRVESYDAGFRKHRVKYDDGDEEEVDLAKEKFEWAAGEDSTPPPPQPVRKLRRLRRMSDTAVAKSPSVMMEDEEDDAGDSTQDEDWEKDAVAEDVSEEVELDDEDDDEEIIAVRSQKGKTRTSSLLLGSAQSAPGSGLTSASGSAASRKRKNVDVASLGCAKKFSFEAVNTRGKVESEVPISCSRSE